MIQTSRRRLVEFFLAAGVCGAVPFSFAASTDKPAKWDQTVDLLVVGTGFAGLACALEAHSLGMKNILAVDKMASPGGNSIINGGAISAAGTDMQKAAGIKDSAELLYRDILRAGGHINHPELARLIADNSLENYLWLRDMLGDTY